MRRAAHVAIAIAGVIATSPLLLLIAVAIKLDTRGPVLYMARRVGLNGRPFRMLKFRTMREDAPADGPPITLRGDSRVTRVGRWLRRTKLDELPQFLNVVIGDMSLVGPRPEDPRYVARYTVDQRQLLTVRPGITSSASLDGWDESERLGGADWERRYCEEILPVKLAMELDYLRRGTLRDDLAILARTFGRLVRPGNSSSALPPAKPIHDNSD
jgi:lipopolysaccharide/colanic/teichoic acid biosynthesis glycosyltransferase